MTRSAEDTHRMPGRLAALLADASTEAVRAAGGRAGGVYLRSSTPGLLRLAVLAGLPGPLFRPWFRMHVDRPFPVADAYRLGVQVVLPNATETMRRYPQFAAGLPFPFGSLYVPVMAAAGSAGSSGVYGVLTVLRPAVTDAAELLPVRERLTRLAEELGADLRGLEAGAVPPVVWDGEPLCVRPTGAPPSARHIGRFAWDPASGAVTTDERLRDLLGESEGAPSVQDLADAVATPGDAHRVLAALQETASGRPPPLPLYVRAEDGALRLIECWTAYDSPTEPADPYRVRGVVLDPSPGAAADAAADLLPDGVFCMDRLGLVMYANPRATQLLRRSRDELLGRSLWEAVPWLNQPACEDHMRSALLAPDPVHCHIRRPADDGGEFEGDWLALSVYPGPDVLTCTVQPAGRVADSPAERASASGASSMAPLYRPIVLAIALTEAVTARQVSAVVMRELLPAFGGRRLAIYLLQDRHLYLAWETGFPPGFLAPFDGVGLDTHLPGVETL
ncbi:PAS domain-containing protein, partial [Streptomyces sp. GESEQ-35]|uniref:PAS domain-containing protein n=1 Tax=Streptomyces sp. GESEQ-35 TaxID=2812657 RepID=UPI001B31CC2E